MTKKRLLLIASFPLAVAMTLGVLAMLPPRPGVTRANIDRIQEGMTRAQVEEIFGRPGDGWNYRLSWSANDGSDVVIWFTDDCVTGKHWFDSEETFLDKIRRWLHLR